MYEYQKKYFISCSDFEYREVDEQLVDKDFDEDNKEDNNEENNKDNKDFDDTYSEDSSNCCYKFFTIFFR